MVGHIAKRDQSAIIDHAEWPGKSDDLWSEPFIFITMFWPFVNVLIEEVISIIEWFLSFLYLSNQIITSFEHFDFSLTKHCWIFIKIFRQNVEIRFEKISLTLSHKVLNDQRKLESILVLQRLTWRIELIVFDFCLVIGFRDVWGLDSQVRGNDNKCFVFFNVLSRHQTSVALVEHYNFRFLAQCSVLFQPIVKPFVFFIEPWNSCIVCVLSDALLDTQFVLFNRRIFRLQLQRRLQCLEWLLEFFQVGQSDSFSEMGFGVIWIQLKSFCGRC